MTRNVFYVYSLTMVFVIILITGLNAQVLSTFGGKKVTIASDSYGASWQEPSNSPENASQVSNISKAASISADIAWVRQDMAEKHGNNVVIIKDNVNLRAGPSTEFKIIRVGSIGSMFNLLGSQSNWYKISLAPIASGSLQPSSPEEIEKAQNDFLSAYKDYTQAVLKSGKNSPSAKKALSTF